MNKAFRKYSVAIVGVAFSVVLAVAAVNFVVNPMGLYTPPLIAGFNDIHPAGQAFSRLQKIEAIKQQRPDAIIIGTSRADNGMDVRADNFPAGYTPYNAGLSAATIREQRAILEFAQKIRPLKLAVITLDFFAFNARRQENKQFEPERLTDRALQPWQSFIDTYGTIVALDTMVASIKHFRYIKKPERYAFTKPNGHKDARDTAFAINRDGAASRFVKDPAATETSIDDFSFNYSDTPGDDSFSHFEAMLELTYSQGIETVLLISPVHETNLRKTADKAEIIAAWKQRLSDINSRVAARHNAKPYPFWDFAQMNSLTMEQVPPAEDRVTKMQWFWDGGHYKAALGDVILRKTLLGSKEHPDFGRRID